MGAHLDPRKGWKALSSCGTDVSLVLPGISLRTLPKWARPPCWERSATPLLVTGDVATCSTDHIELPTTLQSCDRLPVEMKTPLTLQQYSQ